MNEQDNYVLPDELDNWEYGPQDYINKWVKNPDDPFAILYCIGAFRKQGKEMEASEMRERFNTQIRKSEFDYFNPQIKSTIELDKRPDSNAKLWYLDQLVHGVRYWLDGKYNEAIQCFEKCQDSFSQTCIGILTSLDYPTRDTAKSFEYLMGVVDRDAVWFQKGKPVTGINTGTGQIVHHHEKDVQVAQYYLGKCYEHGYSVRLVKDPNQISVWHFGVTRL